MSDTRASIAYLNGISMHAISRCEKYLRSLPEEGTPCDIKYAKPLAGDNNGARGTGDVVATSKDLKIRDEPRPLTLSPKKEKNKRTEPLKSLIKCRPTIIVTAKNPPVKAESDSDESSKDKKKEKQEKPEKIKKPRTPTEEEKVIAESPPREAISSSKLECKVLADQVRVHPILTCAGVILEVDVEVTIPSGDVKKIKLAIECPDFKPKRIKVGGKWKEIV